MVEYPRCCNMYMMCFGPDCRGTMFKCEKCNSEMFLDAKGEKCT